MNRKKDTWKQEDVSRLKGRFARRKPDLFKAVDADKPATASVLLGVGTSTKTAGYLSRHLYKACDETSAQSQFLFFTPTPLPTPCPLEQSYNPYRNTTWVLHVQKWSGQTHTKSLLRCRFWQQHTKIEKNTTHSWSVRYCTYFFIFLFL